MWVLVKLSDVLELICLHSSPETGLAEITKDITGSVDALMMSSMSPGTDCRQRR